MPTSHWYFTFYNSDPNRC